MDECNGGPGRPCEGCSCWEMADAFEHALRRPRGGSRLPDAYLGIVQEDLSARPILSRDERESLLLVTNELRARRAPWN